MALEIARIIFEVSMKLLMNSLQVSRCCIPCYSDRQGAFAMRFAELAGVKKPHSRRRKGRDQDVKRFIKLVHI